ncbi:GNAT family N-acetyltransferase [Leifsonia shinshuensis]|uniref:Ribosomal protein S18 acetylase RimI-like enzyme n=1 Tax=Leifsonia shinshuensis TaxID=150026 RepID=A0A853CTS3_9MICO|nr:ribosomal protein S18 acetylase RimI-like enzyme [Leifsonia shinshuensis]
MHALDDPAWNALTGPHAAFAVGDDRARRYPADMSPFASVADHGSDTDWSRLASLVAPGETLGVFADAAPEGWEAVAGYDCYQYVFEGAALPAAPVLGDDARLVPLGEADVADALDLVERTRPGPFFPRTIDFGGYHGVRVGDRLAAMAGQRMRPDGWCEVSAVCSDPEWRGRGFAVQVMLAVMRGILDRGERPFLHVETVNERAIAVYERLGFTRRKQLSILVCRVASHTRAESRETLLHSHDS